MLFLLLPGRWCENTMSVYVCVDFLVSTTYRANLYSILLFSLVIATRGETPLNKLHEIAPLVNEPRTHHLKNRRDQFVFNRCRIGHSRLELLLKGEPLPCNCPLTIKKLLIECADFNVVWQRFYQVSSLQDLSKTVKPELIFDFLIESSCAVQAFMKSL